MEHQVTYLLQHNVPHYQAVLSVFCVTQSTQAQIKNMSVYHHSNQNYTIHQKKILI